MDKQKTLKSPVAFKGRGIHTGTPVELTIKPEMVNKGINFLRTDLPESMFIPAKISSIRFDRGYGRQTTLGSPECSVSTIEHLMATLNCLGVDNALIEVSGPELPALDGSARDYVEKISDAGLVEQNAEKECLKVEEVLKVTDGDTFLEVYPCDRLCVEYLLDYDHPHLSKQKVSFDIDEDTFKKEIAPARTFCLKQEAELLLAKGFGKGANHDNTLIFENDLPVNNELRYPDEAARHKVLDFLGDIYVIGRKLKAKVICRKSGHKLNLELARRLVEMSEKKKKHEVPAELDVKAIQKIIPHRQPFLLVDKVTQLRPGITATGFKNVTMNENFFQGHFPGHPVMPGVLIIEAMAQVGGVVMLSQPEFKNKFAYFMSIDSAKFRQPVVPGDTLRMEVEITKARARTGQCAGKAYVGDKVVCETEVKFAVVDKE